MTNPPEASALLAAAPPARRTAREAVKLSGQAVLARRGINVEPGPRSSGLRFPDGAHFRLEIPSVEGPGVFRAVIDQAAAEGITLHRVSQSSGALLPSAAARPERAWTG